MMQVLRKIYTDKTFLVTLALALIAILFGHVAPGDIDLKTIFSLLALIIVVSVYEQLHILAYIANTIVAKCRSTRDIIGVMLLFSFVGAMLVTNDVAILTLVPIFFNISRQVHISKIVTISLLTIYANLGSAITPFGNPQNLYLASYYHLSLPTFMALSLPMGLIGLASLFLVTCLFPARPITNMQTTTIQINAKKVRWLLLVTVIVLLGILSVLPVWTAVVASLLAASLLDKRVLAQVDYGIILTFINFFLIVGAISRVPAVHHLLSATTSTTLNTFFTSVLSSQVISNVPAAVLLSKFTHHVAGLYLGVTVGGLGTLIASLANLLALRQYHLFAHDGSSMQFFKTFTWLNSVYLVVFLLIGSLLLIF
ncbi:MAG: SLC13 family permease [Leuconostoc sp.]|uniref:SLC13 family permease n=1 Tax=Leuconostoc sp. TaxID=1930076 RepID=UPI0039E93083